MMSKPGPHPIDPKVRFTRFFEAPPTGCWEWQGARFGSGYGQFYAGRDSAGKRMNIHAHRFAYELRHGAIPDGLHVLHHCDNPPCVNPDHLFVGTRSDNMQDMFVKGRGRPAGKAQLTTDEVDAIRAALQAGEQAKKLAREFGVSIGLICAIGRGEVWQFHTPEKVDA